MEFDEIKTHTPIIANVTGIPYHHLLSLFPHGLYGVESRGDETYAIIGIINNKGVDR